MTATITARTPSAGLASTRLALAVADVNWFTTEHLFREVPSARASALLLRCSDFVNAWRAGQRPWTWQRPSGETRQDVWQRTLVLPSGWMKRFPRLGMRPIARAIRTWHRRHAAGSPLALVMSYPHYLHLRDLVRPDVLVYFNLDDYTMYWPNHARRLVELEQQAVLEADLTVCVSRVRCETLQAALPGAADKIRHLPHGAPTITLTAPDHRPAPPPRDLASLPRPLLGFVGSLGDRVDWQLLERLSVAFSGGSIVLVGRAPAALAGADGIGWFSDCERCLARPNVHLLGWRDQPEIGEYIRAFDVCLIPYRPEHPFNVTCCPTKIMDYMATGRPIVSTDLPECRLSSHLFDVAADDAAFERAVRAIVAKGSDDGRAQPRFDWACANSCERQVTRLLDWLGDRTSTCKTPLHTSAGNR